MADKNRNGIPDDRERGVRVPRANGGVTFGSAEPGSTPRPSRVGFKQPGTDRYAPSQQWSGLLGEGLNFLTDAGRNLTNFFTTPEGSAPRGGGVGDWIFGSNPNDAKPKPRMRREPFFKAQGGPQGTSPLSFADALAQALGMLGGQGGGEIPMMNFDPERNALRSQASEADSRLGAMYRQLQGSIEADAPQIQGAYQQAIDSTNSSAGMAQANAQGAVDASQARNQSVLANLGIEDANAQIIGEGRDANTQAAAAMQDMAQAQQAATTNLSANQASSVQQNRSIGSAAGLEGNLQRAQNQARLQSLLAQIDMEEQGQNSQIAQQNASRQQSGMGNALSLASQLYGYNREDIASENNLQMEAMKMNQPSDFMQMMQNFEMLTQDRGGDLGPVVDSSTLTPEQLASILKAIR